VTFQLLRNIFDNHGIFSKIRKFSVIVFYRRCVPYAIVESLEMNLLFTIVFKPEESLTIHKRVHLLALVGSLASFVDLKSDVARCPKHVLSDLGPESLLASPCARA
jgi:hypothetical protein